MTDAERAAAKWAAKRAERGDQESERAQEELRSLQDCGRVVAWLQPVLRDVLTGARIPKVRYPGSGVFTLGGPGRGWLLGSSKTGFTQHVWLTDDSLYVPSFSGKPNWMNRFILTTLFSGSAGEPYYNTLAQRWEYLYPPHGDSTAGPEVCAYEDRLPMILDAAQRFSSGSPRR
jgi:hypothetical protein